MLNISAIRKEFPIFSKDLIYLDSAATAHKPRCVINAVKTFYECDNANVHRGMHALTEQATVAYEDARQTVQKFLNAKYPEEIIFTKGCTESINLVAQCSHPSTVALSILEHHSNIVPWMQKKSNIHWIDIDDDGELCMDQLNKILHNKNINLVSITGLSNVTGYRPPLKKIIQSAHDSGAHVLIDAAQLVAHHPIDVLDLDCDFLAFSGHKLYGPTGIGVLYAKKELLQSMPSYMGGGMMIRDVGHDGFITADIPHKFEAGTPPIAQAIGLATAIKWISRYDRTDIERHEKELMEHAMNTLGKIDGLSILGLNHKLHPHNSRSGCLSFIVKGIHPHDLTDIIGQQHICLRAGHHCAQPLHDFFGIKASTRVSFGIYNTKEEVDLLSSAIQKVKTVFA